MILYPYALVLVLVFGFGEISFRPVLVHVLQMVRFRRKIKMSISVLFQGVNEITGLSFWTYKIKCVCVCVGTYVHMNVHVCTHMCARAHVYHGTLWR